MPPADQQRSSTEQPSDAFAALTTVAPLPFPPLSLFNDKNRTISHALAQDSKLAPKKARTRLFPKPNVFKRFYRRWFIKWDLTHVRRISAFAELSRALAHSLRPAAFSTCNATEKHPELMPVNDE